MSTIVCQNFTSCFESQQLTETTTTLKLKVAAHLDQYLCKNQDDARTNLGFGNWGSLQTAPKPLLSRLSAKSLELCTENLGSESGSDTVTGGATVFCASVTPEVSTTASFGRASLAKAVVDDDSPRNPRRRKPARAVDFPPPLTTMTCGNPLQVRRRSEGGRLIVEAVAAPFANSYLQIERSDGRLRMSYFSPPPEATPADSAYGGRETEEEEEEREEGDGDECGKETAAVEAAAEEEEEEEEEGIEDGGVGIESEKDELIDGEIKLEKFHQSLSRCKEGSHGSQELCCNWKPAALWVATS